MKIINSKKIGKFKNYKYCRFCYSKTIVPVINLGYVPLAGGFLKNKSLFSKEKFYPLEIFFCRNCFLLQSVNVVDKDILFKDYFYRSSAIKTLTNHFENIAQELKPRGKFIVEIGCNDGSFIKGLLRNRGKAIGIDPAKNIVTPLVKRGYPIINDYFTLKLARKLVKSHGKADYICSFNTMAHIENMHDVLSGISLLLKDDGIFIFEVHYLGNLLSQIQYDMIYHEHQYYYSLLSLKNFLAIHDMEIFNIKPINIHAGSMRYYVRKKGNRKQKVNNKVSKQLKKELKEGFNKTQVYLEFNKRINQNKKAVISMLNEIKKAKKSIVGYGASGRGTIIMNFCDLDKKYLNHVIDDSPSKQGNYIPGVHYKIINSQILNSKNRPDFVLLFAWSFLNEIKSKHQSFINNGGKFIIPIPKVKVI